MEQDFAALERSGWSDVGTARAYADDFAQASAQSLPEMLQAAQVEPGQLALDLCCGHGLVAEALVRAGAEVTGLDFSPAMLQLASARVPEADLIEGDAADLPFAAEQFDAVTVGFGIPHVPDAPAVFSEVRRVLKPGGRFAYSVWAEGEGAMCYVFEAIAAHGAEGIALPPGPGVHDYADTDRAQRALADAGFVAFHIAQVDSHWTVTDPGSPYDFFKDGTVRGGALLRVQPPANAQAIRHAVAERVAMAHGAGPRWDVPIPSVVVSAVAP